MLLARGQSHDLLLQQGVDALQVFGLECAAGLAQLELAQQDVVTGFGQIALGLVQLALAVEHIDVDFDTHLVAEFVGIQSSLAGGLGRFEGLDLAQTRLQPQIGGAGGLRHLALSL